MCEHAFAFFAKRHRLRPAETARGNRPLEFVFVFPAMRRQVRGENQIERVIGRVESRPAAAKRRLQVHIPFVDCSLDSRAAEEDGVCVAGQRNRDLLLQDSPTSKVVALPAQRKQLSCLSKVFRENAFGIGGKTEFGTLLEVEHGPFRRVFDDGRGHRGPQPPTMDIAGDKCFAGLKEPR